MKALFYFFYLLPTFILARGAFFSFVYAVQTGDPLDLAVSCFWVFLAVFVPAAALRRGPLVIRMTAVSLAWLLLLAPLIGVAIALQPNADPALREEIPEVALSALAFISLMLAIILQAAATWLGRRRESELVGAS